MPVITLHVRERKDWLLINMLGKIRKQASKKKFKSNYNESIIKKKKKKVLTVAGLREIILGWN